MTREETILEQEPSDDCVSRQAVEDALYDYSMNCDVNYNNMITEYIDTIPSVTPKPKMGRWVDDKCSSCGKGIEDLIDSREWYRNEEPKFCPFCGIKLVNPQESEE